MFKQAFSQDVHTFSQGLNIPYRTLTDDEKGILYKSVDSVIVPKLQDVLRNGGGNAASFVSHIKHAYKTVRENYNFTNVDLFVENYLSLLERKHTLHQELSGINGNKEQFKGLTEDIFALEVDFFAYSMFTKEYAEGLINYLVRTRGSSFDDISQPPMGSFFQHFYNDIYKMREGYISKDAIINGYFNQERPFFDEYMRSNNIAPQSNIPIHKTANTDNDLLSQSKDKLLLLDHVLDKYLAVKNPYLHDIVSYIQLYLGGEISNATIERSIEILYGGDKNTKDVELTKSYKGITPLKSGISSEVLYNKSTNLSILANFGYNVPDGIIFNPELIKKIYSHGITDAEKDVLLDYIIEKFGDDLIVRSNFLGEDSSNKSFAGHFMSKRVLQREEAFDIMKNVVHSGDAYADAVKPGMLIQRFIPGDFSGVAFIQDDRVIIELVEGTNFKLVDGTQTPQHYEMVGSDFGFVDMPDSLRSVLPSLINIRNIFNDNVDVEFTIKDNVLYPLQSRYITTKLQQEAYKEITSNVGGLTGVVLSAGQGKGKLISYEELQRLDDEDSQQYIIHTKFLDTNIVPYLYKGNIKGIITNTGGQLAHLCIVARELGIPVVHISAEHALMAYKNASINGTIDFQS